MRTSAARGCSAAGLLLSVVNLALACLSVCMAGVGVWVLVAPDSLATFVQQLPSTLLKLLLPRAALTTTLGAALLLTALLLLPVAALGLRATYTRDPHANNMYALLMVTLLLLQGALLYYVTADLTRRGVAATDGAWSHAVRATLSCCDANHTSVEPLLPWSCCPVEAGVDCTAHRIHNTTCAAAAAALWAGGGGAGLGAGWAGAGLLVAAHLVLVGAARARRAPS